MKKVYWKVLQAEPRMKDFFPDYDPEYVPPRSFFWAVYKTVNPWKAKELIDEAMKLKLNEQEEEGELIKITADFLTSIKEYHYKKCKLFDCRGKR